MPEFRNVGPINGSTGYTHPILFRRKSVATQTELQVIASASQAPEPKNKKSTRRSKRKSRKYADKQADGRKQKSTFSHGHPETKKKYGPDRRVTKPLAREA